MTNILPSLPDWPINGPLILFPAQWHALGLTLAALHADNEANAKTLAALNINQEILMATVDDLNAQLDSIKASETAEAASLSSLGTALGTIIADLHALPPVGTLTQAQLDAVVQKATDDATAAAANAATGSAQSTQATGAVPPTA